MRYETINKIYKIMSGIVNPDRVINNDKFYYDLFDDSIRYIIILQTGLYLIRFNNGVGIIFDSLIRNNWDYELYLLQFNCKTVASIEVD